MNPLPDPEPVPPIKLDPGADTLGRELDRLTRRGFAVAGAAGLATLGGWQWLRTRSAEAGMPWPFRRVIRLDERVARATFSPARLAPTFPDAELTPLRTNGSIGMDDDAEIDPARWRLSVQGPGGAARSFTLDEIKALPRHEEVTELKCIEGWAQKARWAGARLADLAALTGFSRHSGKPYDAATTPADLLGYVAMATPDRGYYVGLDMPSALHPQTLLAYDLDGAPLSNIHGAPLRLAIPLKYGIKNLKRIGTIRFADERPADYWAEYGYDWYAGH